MSTATIGHVRLFAALADATRFQIVERLLAKPGICVSELAKELGVTPSAISQQCRLLELSGLLNRRRIGQRICYRLNQENKEVDRFIRFAFNQRSV
ncbi:winged helix-turn-helix transcriptional regulator [Candidatus Microgenomates bacterium]|nr:winged helix-turn-helix transcriptional regulator [Candidatus Microgenomates bacterium]